MRFNIIHNCYIIKYYDNDVYKIVYIYSLITNVTRLGGA